MSSKRTKQKWYQYVGLGWVQIHTDSIHNDKNSMRFDVTLMCPILLSILLCLVKYFLVATSVGIFSGSSVDLICIFCQSLLNNIDWRKRQRNMISHIISVWKHSLHDSVVHKSFSNQDKQIEPKK